MVGDVVFVGQQQRHDARVILVGQPVEGVTMIQICFIEALHCVLDTHVDVIIALEIRGRLALAYLAEAVNSVCELELPIDLKIQPDVDAFVLETLDPPVQLCEHAEAQVPRIQRGPVAEDVRNDPGRVMMMDTYEIEAQLRQAVRLKLDVFTRRSEQSISREIGSPKAAGVPSSNTSLSLAASRSRACLPVSRAH